MPDPPLTYGPAPLDARTPLPTAILELVAERAGAVDRDERPAQEILEALAADDLLACGLPDGPGPLTAMAAIVAALAERCLATGFVTWAHRMALEYLVAAGDEEGADELRTARRVGSSAMAGAFRAGLGLAALDLTARRQGGELVVDGSLPWASNLVPDAVVVTAAEVADEGPVVIAVNRDAPGLRVRAYRELLALDATASGGLAFERVRVPREAVLDTAFSAFLARVRPAFLTLQTAFCLGLARAALQAGGERLEGLGAEFAGEHQELERERDAVERRLAHQASDEDVPMRERVALRLDAAVLAREAVRVEAAVSGGRGYLLRSDTARRLREAAFIPVQSPTETQLRWELRHSA